MRCRRWIQAAACVCWWAVSGCGSEDAASSQQAGTAVLGTACSEADFEANTKPCSASGDTVLECYNAVGDPAAPPYTWNLDKDCKADGKVCASGSCVLAAGGGPRAGDACSEADFKANTKPCSASGDTVLECYNAVGDPAAPPYTWNLDKDCKADGKVCASGSCAAPP